MSRKNEASIKITAQNKMKAGIQDATNELGNFGKVINNLGKLTLGAGIGAAIYKIGQAAKDCTANFMETEDSYLRMSKALNKNDYEHAIQSINKFSRQTKASRDEVATMISTLSSLGKTTEEIDKIAEAAISLANVTGKDLNSSMEIMLDSLNGSTGEIEKYLPQVKNLTEEEKKLGGAIDTVINKFGNLSSEISGESFSQTVKNIKSSMDSIAESIGGILTVTLGPIFEWIEEKLAKIADDIRTAKELTESTSNWEEYYNKNRENIKSGNILGEGFNAFYADVKKYNLLPALLEWKEDTEHLLSTNTGGTEGYLRQAAILNPETNILLEAINKAINMNAMEARWKGLESKYASVQKEITDKQMAAATAQEEAAIAEKNWANKLASLNASAELAYNKVIASSALSHIAPGVNSNIFKPIDDNFGNLLSIGLGNFNSANINKAYQQVESIIEEAIAPFNNYIEVTAQDQLNQLNELKETLTGYLDVLDSYNKQDTDLYKSIEGIIAGIDNKTAKIIKEIQKDAKPENNNLIAQIPALWDKMLGEDALKGSIMGSLMESFFKLFDAIQPIMLMLENPVWTMIATIAEGFVNIMAPAITQTIQPFFDALNWVGESIANLFMPVFDSLYPYFSIVAQIIETVIAPCLQIIVPFLQAVAVILDIIRPILVAVAVAFEYIMAPVKWLGDLFSWCGEWIKTFGHNIGIFVHNLAHPFRKKSYESGPGAFNSTAFSGLDDRIAHITELNNQQGAISGSTETAVNGATYNGGMTVTINNNFYAPVVGEDGMDQFAVMIRDKFIELDYFGI